jgi:hypothetical protein
MMSDKVRDSDGDVWEQDEGGDWNFEGNSLPDIDVLERVWGPLSEVEDDG